MTNEIFERKFEIDSLAAVLSLSAKYYNATGDKTPFNDRWVRAIKLIMSTARKNQVASSPYTSYEYSFTRSCNRPTETLMDGQGWPSRFTGLVENRHWCKRRSEVHSVHRTTRRSFRTSFPETSCSSRRCVSVRTFWRRWLG